jgi:HK97 family phage portal protein
MSPVSVAARVGDVDNSTTDYLKLFFEHGGMPLGIITSKQRLISTQVDALRAAWKKRYGGFANWMEPAILDSEASYQKIGLDFREMGFEILDARNEARICMTLDIPPIMVGAKVGLDAGTYSNYAQARTSWWQDSLLPLYKHILDEISSDLLPDFGQDIYCEWDFSSVPALQEDVNGRWNRATNAFRAGAITRNEFYEEVGLAMRGPEADIYVQSPMLTEIPAPQMPVKILDIPTELKLLPPKERAKQEKVLQRAMEGYFSDQLDRVTRELRKNNGR